MSKLTRYGTFNTRDALKVLALVLMVIDHIGAFFYPGEDYWRVFGRGAAPIFLFLAGYAGSYRISKQLWLGMGLLCLVPFFVKGGDFFSINILLTIILARLLLQQVENGRLPLINPFVWMMLFVILFPTTAIFQYGTVGILFAIGGYMHQRPERYRFEIRGGFLLLLLTIYGLLEATSFPHLDFFKGAALLSVLIGLFFLLLTAHIRPLPKLKTLPPLYFTLLFFARYTLWLYVVHYAAFQLIAQKTL